ncbi:hypothetical protein [Nonomuraea sp. LPB2021202275-12-8]
MIATRLKAFITVDSQATAETPDADIYVAGIAGHLVSLAEI